VCRCRAATHRGIRAAYCSSQLHWRLKKQKRGCAVDGVFSRSNGPHWKFAFTLLMSGAFDVRRLLYSRLTVPLFLVFTCLPCSYSANLNFNPHPTDTNPARTIPKFKFRLQLQTGRVMCYMYIVIVIVIVTWFKCRAGTCTGGVGMLACLYRASWCSLPAMMNNTACYYYYVHVRL
jgi:hypothetical protein